MFWGSHNAFNFSPMARGRIVYELRPTTAFFWCCDGRIWTHRLFFLSSLLGGGVPRGPARFVFFFFGFGGALFGLLGFFLGLFGGEGPSGGGGLFYFFVCFGGKNPKKKSR